MGWVSSYYQAVTATFVVRQKLPSKQMNYLINSFWESEDPPIDAQGLSPDDQLAASYCQDTTEMVIDAIIVLP